MQIEVRVLELRGETGLRKPGTSYFLDEVIAASFEGHGWVEIVKVKKQEKVKLETKEEKFVKKPKVTKVILKVKKKAKK